MADKVQKRNSVIGIFDDKYKADSCYTELLAAGVSPSEVSIMMSDSTRARYYSADTEDDNGSSAGNKAAEGAGVGGAIGTVVGATIAGIAAIGTTLALPGLGLILAGPIAAALAGGASGALTGGVIGGLVGWGLSEQNAQVYNDALLSGGIVMAVDNSEGKRASKVHDIMVRAGGKEVCNNC